MKKTVCVIIIFFTIISCAMCIPVSADSSEISYSSAEEMADYVTKNLGLFVFEYNSQIVENNSKNKKVYNEKMFTPEFCEKRFTVPLKDSEEYVVCLDFNASNGYMIISNDSVIKLNTSDDLNYIIDSEKDVYFSIYDDDFVGLSNGEYVKLGYLEESIETPDSYAGTDSNGVIKDKESYVQDRYGNTEIGDHTALSYFDISKADQESFSVYKNSTVEGNCSLVAMFNFLMTLRNCGTLTTIPGSNNLNTIIPQNDYFYNQAISSGYTAESIEIPTLYYQIRQLAIASYGYTVSNGKMPNGTLNSSSINTNNTSNFLNTIGSYYGANINVRQRVTLISTIANQIENGNPVLWYTGSEDPIYGDHAVVICGHVVHKKYTTILGIKVCTETINMLVLINGWDTRPVFYDFETIRGHIFTID